MPMFHVDACTTAHRGKNISAEPVFFADGILIAYWFGWL